MTENAFFEPSTNLIVTGIPRAGTTLTSALIDAMEDAVCINEPIWQSRWSREERSRQRYVERIVADFAKVRAKLIEGGSVNVRASGDGTLVTNFFDQSAGGRKRKPLTTAPMSRPGLSQDFLLGMKHNAHYTCVLEELAATPGFSVLAAIRDPLATLVSWRSLSVPVSRGRLPAAEPFWPEIFDASRDTDDILVAQARILELFFRRYRALSDRIAIVRLEDIIADPRRLNRLLGRAQRNDVAIEPSRLASAAPDAERKLLGEYIKAYCPTAAEYYHPTG